MEINTVLVRRENLRTRLCAPPHPHQKKELKKIKDPPPSASIRTAGSTGKLISLSIILLVIVVALASLARRWQQMNVRAERANRLFDCFQAVVVGKGDEVMEDGVVEAASSGAEGVGDATYVADEGVGDTADVAHGAAEIEEKKSYSITECIVKTKIVLGLYQIIGSVKWSLPSVVFPKLLQVPLSIGNLVQCGVRLKKCQTRAKEKETTTEIRSSPDESYPLPEFDFLSLNLHR